MTVGEVRDTLAEALKDAGLYVAKNRGATVAGYPAAILSLDSAQQVSWPSWSYTFTVTVLVSQADNQAAWEKLDLLIDEDAVAEALRDKAYDVGAYESIGVEQDFAGGTFLGFEVEVTVLA